MNARTMKHAVIVLVLSASAFAQTWVEFSLASKGLGTRPDAINSSGQVVGWYENGAGHVEGFIRNTDGTITKLSSPKKGISLTPTAINTAGEVAGNLLDYNQQVGFYDLPPAPFQQFGANWTDVGAINDAGYIAGAELFCQGCKVWRGFLLSPNGSVITFLIPGANSQASVTGLNNTNQVVGFFYPKAGRVPGFLYDSGKMTYLNAPGAVVTTASGINDGGEVAGVWLDSSNVNHGFIWKRAKGFTSFDLPHGSTTGGVSGINSGGAVVGDFRDAKGDLHGFIRDAAGHFTILSAPHASSTWALGINASGQVTGFYVIETGTVSHAFIYTP
jgi:hypothetical protein